ncbi:hypothetical protein BpHYR1_051595 [Brachionus plicatilis]|uniref:Uncharacterized protein n=1 Tax=Brachionus plicatilis TaxID=10195 RepID=A0A3M7R2L0_BRAPC|nr:hypothetical protein BpHYR1_051595 [Brachionus plicatilis]
MWPHDEHIPPQLIHLYKYFISVFCFNIWFDCWSKDKFKKKENIGFQSNIGLIDDVLEHVKNIANIRLIKSKRMKLFCKKNAKRRKYPEPTSHSAKIKVPQNIMVSLGRTITLICSNKNVTFFMDNRDFFVYMMKYLSQKKVQVQLIIKKILHLNVDLIAYRLIYNLLLSIIDGDRWTLKRWFWPPKLIN